MLWLIKSCQIECKYSSLSLRLLRFSKIIRVYLFNTSMELNLSVFIFCILCFSGICFYIIKMSGSLKIPSFLESICALLPSFLPLSQRWMSTVCFQVTYTFLSNCFRMHRMTRGSQYHKDIQANSLIFKDSISRL